jgi:hypothetical protein
MRQLTVTILVFFASPILFADDAADAGAKLHEYFATFNQKDVKKVANEIYSTPVHIGGGDNHRVLADPEAAVENLSDLYAQIEAQGWVESRISDLKICLASSTLALVDTRYARLDEEGMAIPPAVRTTLYVLQKLDGDWRIVAFYGHDNESRPSCN